MIALSSGLLHDTLFVIQHGAIQESFFRPGKSGPFLAFFKSYLFFLARTDCGLTLFAGT